MEYKLWFSACIVCVIILTVSLSLIGLYGFDVFDYTNDTYNQYSTMALFGLGLVSAIGLYASAQQMSLSADKLPQTEEKVVQQPVSDYATLPNIKSTQGAKLPPSLVQNQPEQNQSGQNP